MSMDQFMQTRVEVGSSDAPLAIPEVAGPWRVGAPLGMGGMGHVHGAMRDDGLYEHKAAIKFIGVRDPAMADRFMEERQRLARLDHPNICRIIDGGATEDGLPYMVMDYVDGIGIDEWVAATDASRRQIVDKVIALCDALAHAHGRLVLHRDIKPSNVLIDETGRVRLIDFGIGSSLEDNTAGAHGALTLATAAPEQLNGQAVGIAVDIFMTGMLVHRLLTGALPRRCDDGSVEVDRGDIRDRDFAAILDRALATDPGDRYESAASLGADLRAWRDGDAVEARDGGAMYRFDRAIRKHWFASALGAALAVSLIVGIMASLAMAQRAERERAKAEFNLTQSRMDNFRSGILADVMQRAFGNAADQERLAEFLLEHHRASLKAVDVQPEQAAGIASVIGQHFMFRNDYPRAIAILEPWIEGGYGDEELRFHGIGMLARSLMDVGRTDDAIRHLRTIVDLHDRRLDRFTATHAASASQLAIASREQDDLSHAREVLLQTMAHNPDTAPFGYLENQLAVVARLQGDFAEAYQYLKKSAPDARRPLTELTNFDTSYMNLAAMELFYRQRPDAAARLLDMVDRIIAQKGESATSGRLAVMRAELALANGDVAGARDSVQRAIVLFARYQGERTPGILRARMLLAEIEARSGDIAGARAMLDALPSAQAQGRTQISVAATRALSRALIDASDAEWTAAWNPDAAHIAEYCVNPDLLRRYARLVAAKRAKPIKCLDRLNPPSG